MTAPGRAVYPALKKDPATRDIPQHHNQEVPELEAAIAEIDRAGFDAPNWKALIANSSQLVKHHAEEEENELFPRAEEALGKKASAELEDRFIAGRCGPRAAISPPAAPSRNAVPFGTVH